MDSKIVELVSVNKQIADRCEEFDLALTGLLEVYGDVHVHDRIAILEATKTAILISEMVDIHE